MTPPNASDPYATDPGPRATSTPSSTNGSRNVALGPTRRSDVTRAPSMRISVRPRARPRIAGTAACPSDTTDTPATFSSNCVRLAGCRTSISRAVRRVVPLPGAVSIRGALPATVTDSSSRGAISSTMVPVDGITSTRTGFMYRPPGMMTSTSNGGAGSGFQVNRPSASVRTTPGRPRMDTSALAIASPVSRCTTRPSRAQEGTAAASITKSARETTRRNDCFTVRAPFELGLNRRR